MTLTEKLDFLRSNKEWKCQMKWEALKEHEATWKTNGLADLKYTLLETTPVGCYQKGEQTHSRCQAERQSVGFHEQCRLPMEAKQWIICP